MKKREKNLDLSIVKKTIDIFKEKGWPFVQSGKFGDDDDDLFEKFCCLLNELSEDEQDLMLTLTESFERFTLNDYPYLCKNALDKIDQNLIKKNKTIYLIPLNSPKDILMGKVKSGEQMAYLAKKILQKLTDPQKHKIIDVANVFKLSELYPKRKGSLIIFIDDFVGTGNTACETIEEYCKNSVNDDEVIIVSAVALEMGIKALNDIGFKIYSSQVLKKGIYDSKRITDKAIAYRIIEGIENRLKISGKFRLGFGRSEALVRMYRTPNNTLPVYWCSEMKNGQNWPAPFPR